MERFWYLARAGQVTGPIPEWRLFQAAAAGQVFPSDWLNPGGSSGWWPASVILGFLHNSPTGPATPGQPPFVAAPAPATPAQPASEFAKLETPADFQARIREKSPPVPAASSASIFEGLVGDPGKAEGKAEAPKSMRRLLDELGTSEGKVSEAPKSMRRLVDGLGDGDKK